MTEWKTYPEEKPQIGQLCEIQTVMATRARFMGGENSDWKHDESALMQAEVRLWKEIDESLNAQPNGVNDQNPKDNVDQI